jgi:predicted nuclease with TOPRIM domain
MTNQVDEIQNEIDYLILEIEEIENKMGELSKDYKQNAGMLTFLDEMANRKTMRYLNLKIKIERMKSNV